MTRVLPLKIWVRRQLSPLDFLALVDPLQIFGYPEKEFPAYTRTIHVKVTTGHRVARNAKVTYERLSPKTAQQPCYQTAVERGGYPPCIAMFLGLFPPSVFREQGQG